MRQALSYTTIRDTTTLRVRLPESIPILEVRMVRTIVIIDRPP